MIVHSSKDRSSSMVIILFLYKYLLLYLAYLPLSGLVLICSFFVMFTVINLTAGDLSLVDFDRIPWIPESGNYDETDILNAFTKITFVFMVVGAVISKLLEVVLRRDIVIPRSWKYKFGLVLITIFMLVAELSIFSPVAPNGAEEIWWMILVFWIVAIGLYSIYIPLYENSNRWNNLR